jgi:hypothetical protein
LRSPHYQFEPIHQRQLDDPDIGILRMQLPYGFYDSKRKMLFMNTTELGSSLFVQLRGWFLGRRKYFFMGPTLSAASAKFTT